MSASIAIVGMASRYPDARSVADLWQNVLAGRRAFRRLPEQRLRLADYHSDDRSAPDRTYSTQAAVIEDATFDRASYRISGSTFRSTDPAHWLALDVARQALADAGFPDGRGLPRDTTGVLLGNTLTGDFSRAASLRLRWPYVRRVLASALRDEGCVRDRDTLLQKVEQHYKEPFAAVTEETLAGGLSNTIAGRICNYFDLRGGGYTVDGACASSLLAVANACSALSTGDLDIALAGGVDLSLDPFELIGFAKTGALARDRMRVFDAHPQGFWPGEGCGFVVLMRAQDADATGRHIYAVIRGWGISSDGSGGLTRPEVDGQLLALTRAYARAAVTPGSVAYFEGHGTGTSVGDVTELRALSRARRETSSAQEPAVIGTIKGNIGHTKAAAGIAGLIKATLALHEQILPPTAGCDEPHPELSGANPALKILRQAQVWPSHLALRAGVSSMGFGGINTHVVLDGAAAARRTTFSDEERRCVRSPQDAELFVFDAETERQLQQTIEPWSAVVEHLSEAELSDVGGALQRRLQGHRIRAAVVASTPGQFADRLRSLSRALCEARDNRTFLIDAENGLFFNVGDRKQCIAFLFPGQGSPTYLTGGAWARRFAAADDVCRRWSLPELSNPFSTATAQPAIVRASVAALRVLESVGLSADVAIGHSLGELTALHWAGTFDEDTLMDLATARGRIMADLAHDEGAMAMVAAPSADVEPWLNGTPVVIAAVNAPRQTVVSGEASAIADVVLRLRAAGIHAVTLPVSGAFHSPLMQPAAPRLAEYLADRVMRSPQRHAISTITGSRFRPDEDIAALLIRQLTSAVRFLDAVRALPPVDLALEIGPGRVLTGIVKEITDIPTVALDAGGTGIAGILHAMAAAFVLGMPVRTHSIWDDRFTRAFDLPWTPKFFVNPCERAPVEDAPITAGTRGESSSPQPYPSDSHPDGSDSDGLRVVRELAARRSELPLEQVSPAHRLLSDLHLNSITVGELVAAAARRLRITTMPPTLELADATITEVAAVLAAAAAGADPRGRHERTVPAGVDAWVRCFLLREVESERPRRANLSGNSGWSVAAASSDPLAHQLTLAFGAIAGSGIVACVPRSPTVEDALRLVEAARAAARGVNGTKFVAVQHGGGASALAKTLFLEAPWVPTVVVDVPVGDPRAPDWILAEAIAAEGFSEVRYGPDGRRTQPMLERLELPDPHGGVMFDPADVVIVTGGGKGIAAECARALGEEGLRLALLGRSDPARDSTLAMNLKRMKAAGVRAEYVSADVADPEAVRAAVRAITTSLGTPTAILHGAGHNTPQLLDALDEPTLRATLAPKIDGARNLLAAIDSSRLKWFVVFGSLTAHTGLRGNAHYALANEWLRRFTAEVQGTLPHCRCLAIEWSLWAGVGMGERIGHLDALLRQGLSPIMADQGIAVLRRLLASPPPSPSVIVTGRIAATPTLQMAPATLPFLRFIEKPRVHYAGIELVADAELSIATDPYVEDHALSGERLLPAVIGLEAMAQAAMAVTGHDRPIGFESIAFHRPVTIAESGSTTVRIAALVRAPGTVDVSIRSATTGFQTDHFTARCRFSCACGEPRARDMDLRSDADAVDGQQLPLDPDRDLYGALLFQRGRFQRLGGYRRLRATECLADIRAGQSDPWFARYLPARLVLGDPGARDAAIHALQSCVPHARLIPTGIGSVDFTTVGADARFVRARETHRDGRVYIYDLDMLAADGRVVEHWTGLQLQQIADLQPPAVWPLPLLAPYLERRIHELDPKVAVKVAVDVGTPERRPRSSTAIARDLLGDDTLVQWRPDGRPEAANGIHLSVAHSEQITLAVAADSTVACDVQAVGERNHEQWDGLLDDNRRRLADLVAHHTTDDWNACATRVWAATECLVKAGAMISTPLLLLACRPDGWVKLGSATIAIETFVGRIHPSACRVAVAILVQCEHAHV